MPCQGGETSCRDPGGVVMFFREKILPGGDIEKEGGIVFLRVTLNPGATTARSSCSTAEVGAKTERGGYINAYYGIILTRSHLSQVKGKNGRLVELLNTLCPQKALAVLR